MAEKKLPPGVPPEQTPIPGGSAAMGPPPKFGTGKPAADAGDLPRLIDPLERSPGKGFARYKVRCNNYHPQRTRYILAKDGDEDGVRALYLRTNGLQRELDRLAKLSIKADEPDLVVTKLPD